VTRRLPADAAVEFLALGFVQSRTVAEFRIATARRAGATDAECAEALTTWERMTAESVQRIESQPTTTPRCKCSHTHPLHLYGSGRCFNTACGCSYWRDPAPARPAGDGDIREYLRQKGEIA
jgi:hypothetical protein